MSGLGRVTVALVAATALAVASPVWAHGGEDHGTPAAPRAAVAGTEHVVAGETDLFSVVVKYPAKTGKGPLTMRVYVARADTSAPIADAAVRFQLKGAVTFDREAAKVGAPGVYEITCPAPPDGAQVNGIVSVQAKDDFDLIVLGDLAFGPPPAPSIPAVVRSPVPPMWLVFAAAALAGLSGAAGFGLGRRSTRRPPTNSDPPPEVTP